MTGRRERIEAVASRVAYGFSVIGVVGTLAIAGILAMRAIEWTLN